MSLTPLDANLIFGLGAFVFFQLSKSHGDERYAKQRKQLTLGPPAWLFGVAWLIIYVFLTVSAYYAFTTVTANYTAMICVFFVNIMLNKYWSVLFFDYHHPVAAMFVLLGMLGTSGAFLAFAWTGSGWGFWAHLIPYVPWCCIALYWNIQIICKMPSDKGDTDDDDDSSIRSKMPVLPFSVKNRLKGGAGTGPMIPPKKGNVVVNL